MSLRSARPYRPRCACNREELKASEHCNIAANIMSVNILYVYVRLSTLRGDAGAAAAAATAGVMAVVSESAEAAYLVPLSLQCSWAKSADSSMSKLTTEQGGDYLCLLEHTTCSWERVGSRPALLAFLSLVDTVRADDDVVVVRRNHAPAFVLLYGCELLQAAPPREQRRRK